VRLLARDGDGLALVSGELEHLVARRAAPAPAPEAVDVAALASRCPTRMGGAELYAFLARTGLEYGLTMTVVEELLLGEEELLARLVARRPARAFDPSLVDGAMQAIAGLAARRAGADPPTFLGFGVGELATFRPLPDTCLAHVALLAPLTAGAELLHARVTLLDVDGAVCVRCDRVALRRASPAPGPARRRAGAVALVRPDGVDVAALRRRLEDAGTFVLETARPRLADAGPLDAIYAVALPAETVDALRALGVPVEVIGAGGSPAPVAARAAARDPGGLRAFLRGEIARSLRRRSGDLDDRASFTQLGVDSLLAVDLVRRLERHLGRRLHPTLLFEHRTIDDAARALEGGA
jgi:acyl carrier protein